MEKLNHQITNSNFFHVTLATMGRWGMDGEELQRKMWLRRGWWGTREGEEVAYAQQECQKKNQEKACKE